jgi:hypothetical protein
MSLQTPEKIRTLQKKLYLKAKAENPDRRGEPAAVGLDAKSIGKPWEIRMHGLMSGDGRRSDGPD